MISADWVLCSQDQIQNTYGELLSPQFLISDAPV